MSKDSDSPQWEKSRLIPVSGIRNAEEQERRATSALLAVLAAVDEFGASLTKPCGAPKGKLQTFIEVPFELADGRKVRPDGLINVSRGSRSWTALVEVKTGNNSLTSGQIEDYLDVAKEQGFDCVITISNQIAKIPGEHPVAVDKRKLRKASLHHRSWSRILTEAVLQKSHQGVADPDQAWILGELIRYLQHPNAGSMEFSDMGEHWVGVRSAVKHGTLRPTDKNTIEVAGKWEELISYVVLQLARKLGAKVQEILSSKEGKDIAVRITNIVDEMVTHGRMSGALRIENTVSNISIIADLRAQQIVASISLAAPKTGRATTKVNWLLRQLKSTSPSVRIDSWGKRSRTSMADLLGNVREKPELLNPVDDREIASFTVSLALPMGLKRLAGQKSFIDSTLQTIDVFYAEVVQHLREWQPPTPKLAKIAPSKSVSEQPTVSPMSDSEPKHPVNKTDSTDAAVIQPTPPAPPGGIETNQAQEGDYPNPG